MLARYPIHTGLPTFPSVPSPHIERVKTYPKKCAHEKALFAPVGTVTR